MTQKINFAKLTGLVALLLTAAMALPLSAQDAVFNGSISNDWNDADNWSPSGLPSGANPLTEIGTGALGLNVATADISGPLTSDTIAELRVGRGDNTNGTVNHSAGTLNTSGWSFVGVDGAGGLAQGTYNLSGSGDLQVNGNMFVGLGGGSGNSSGTFNISDNSVLSLNGDLASQAGAFVVGANDGNNGVVNQTGGSVTYNAWMTVGESSGATGIYNISAGSLNQNSDWLTIGEGGGANGSLNVSGTADINLNANGFRVGRFGDGTGSINIDGSTATIDTTGLHLGVDEAFNVSGTANLNYVADALGVSAINATDVFLNDGTVSGGSSLGVDLSSYTAGASEIVLVNVDGSVTGTFVGLAEGAVVAGTGYRITYAGGDGNDISLLAVPEPGSMIVLTVGLGVAAFRRRRR
ncbi:MAG: PEP-CTERM sorting domain-containing protein [Planctomycetota bacterium]